MEQLDDSVHCRGWPFEQALHAAVGSVGDAIWQSGIITNTATNAWISVPVSQGTPTRLQRTGTNDLCWQVDTTADVPSYLVGTRWRRFPAARRLRRVSHRANRGHKQP